MGQQCAYEYHGETYSQTGLAVLAGLKGTTVRKRLRAGWSVEDVVETPVTKDMRGRDRRHVCLVDGAEMGVLEVSEMTGLSKDAIYQRIHRGESLQHIADNPTREPRKKKTFLYRGKECTSEELARIAGISISTLAVRLKSGETVEQVVAEGRRKPAYNNRRYLYKGKMMLASELAELPECKVSFGTLRARLRYKWPAERAVSEPLQEHPPRSKQ